MKKLLSTLMIATVLGSASYAPKSHAGILVIFGAGCIFLNSPVTGQFKSRGYESAEEASSMYAFGTITAGAIGAGLLTMGGISCTGGPNPVCVLGLVLSEDGHRSQTELESTLAQKYDFIADREVISILAQTIKSKAESMKGNAQDVKMVSLSEDEVKSILSATELTEEEISIVTNDLK